MEDKNYPSPRDFYENICKPLIKDIVLLEYTGIPIDLDTVKETESTIQAKRTDLLERLRNNPFIKEFFVAYRGYDLEQRRKRIYSAITIRQPVFSFQNIAQRSFIVNQFFKEKGIDIYKERWSKKELKAYARVYPSIIFDTLLNDKEENVKEFILPYMEKLEKERVHREIEKRLAKLKATEEVTLDDLNKFLRSVKQKTDFFSFLNIASPVISKATKQDSWNKDALVELKQVLELEIANKEINDG